MSQTGHKLEMLASGVKREEEKMDIDKKELFILNQRRSEAQRLLVSTYELFEPNVLTSLETDLFNRLVNSLNDTNQVVLSCTI